MKFLFTVICFLFLAGGSSAQLIINEVLYDPSNDTTGGILKGDANGDGVYDQFQDEFIEFVNKGATQLNVSNYKIFEKVKATGIKTRRHTMPNVNVPSNGALVVFGGGSAVGNFGGAIVVIDSGTAGLSLANSGEIIIIEDSSGNVIDSMDTDALSNNPDESYTRNPDITGDFVQHAGVTPGRLFSPGTRVNGDAFNTVLLTPTKGSRFDITVFPNPSRGKIRIIDSGFAFEAVDVFNLTGQLLKKFKIVDGLIDLGELPEGLFQLRFNGSKTVAYSKILISR